MSEYFSYLPNFEYINRGPNDQQITEYTKVKNLFKRVKFSNDLFQDLTSYTKYKIIGDERPDNVANKIENCGIYSYRLLGAGGGGFVLGWGDQAKTNIQQDADLNITHVEPDCVGTRGSVIE